jgi:hypothetical protein
VDEIRSGFSEQRKLHEAIERWRSQRAELVVSGGGPVQLVGPVTMLFHAIPALAFNRDVLRATWTVPEHEKNHIHVPHGATAFRYNADGFLCLASGTEAGAHGYTQLFRSGIVEYSDSYCYGPAMAGRDMIFGQELEKQMVNCYKDALSRFRTGGQPEPVYVGFSLIGIADRSFYSTARHSIFQQSFIRQNIFTSPEVFMNVTDGEESPFGRTLLPLVDTMWQVGGRAGTPFRSKGEWNPFGRYE